MNLSVRKFVVGIVALGVLLGVYGLYMRLNRAPKMISGPTESLPEVLNEVNAPDPQRQVGTIFDVGVGEVRQTQFVHRNESNRVDRKFGFEELLHDEGDQWEITHPYMELFLPAFRCRVTADRGKVLLETAFGRPTPNDATFSGNVIIHIVPVDPNDSWESFIHLDDVGFLAAKSMFTSSGAVRFLSRSIQLVGTGMELLYDEPRSRLELFHILDLDSLRLRSSDLGSVADPNPARHSTAESASPDRVATQQASTVADPNGVQRDNYQCIFRENVVIETPERAIAAGDVLAINNIPWPHSGRTDRAEEQIAEPNEEGPLPFPGPDALDTTASSYVAISTLPESLFDVVVTCDGGFVVTPVGATSVASESAGATSPQEPRTPISPGAGIPPDRQRAVARRIDFDASSYDTVLAGPVEMMFHIDSNGLSDGKAGGTPLPMVVKAGGSARFLAVPNQILLDGGCSLDLQRSEPNLDTAYSLTAPRLTLDLVADPNAKNEAAVAVRQFVADGGPVAVRILRRHGDRVLGWTELDASQLLCGEDLREFTVYGPGQIWLHNAEPMPGDAAAEADPNGFSLSRPCYARLTNFDVLRYTASTNKIIAEDESQQLLLDYFPLIDGQYGRHTSAVAGHVEAILKDIDGGGMELATLTASQGIEFEDETDYHFVGSVLVYDHTQSLITVTGDDMLPCNLNGALVDEIRMNLQTGHIEAPISTPSLLQVRR